MHALLLLLAVQLGSDSLPPPRGYVNDFAGVLDPASVSHMEAVIAEVRAKSRGEIAVVTLPDIGDRAASDVARSPMSGSVTTAISPRHRRPRGERRRAADWPPMGRGRQRRSRRPGQERGRRGANRPPEASSPRHGSGVHRDGPGCRGVPARRASGTNPRRHDPVPRPRGLRRRTRGRGRPDRAGVRGRVRLHTDRTTAATPGRCRSAADTAGFADRTRRVPDRGEPRAYPLVAPRVRVVASRRQTRRLGRWRGRGLRRRLRWIRRRRGPLWRRRGREILAMAKLTVEQFAQQVAGALGDRLEALLLYGSAARGTHVPDRSALNTLLIWDAVDEDLFAPLAPPVREWVRGGHPAPLILTEREWRSSADAFPIEYEDMRDAHRLLAGRNPWAGVTVRREDLRRELEQELKGKLVRLRQAYVAFRSEPKRLGPVLVRSAAGFFTM